jgi:hypothetical protein
MMLFDLKPRCPGTPAGIDLRCCDVTEILREARGARLIHADPPWRYHDDPGSSNPEANGIYQGLPDTEIATHLDAAYDCAGPSARLAVWYTWPKEEEWREAGQAGPRWGRRKTGGSWLKTGGVGVGYHWRGRTEPVAIFTRGATGRPGALLLNGYASAPTGHSEKPVEWLRQWVRAWTEPGDLVVDLYAGLSPLARACAVEGRRYLGAEIDPERHRKASVALDAYLGGEA